MELLLKKQPLNGQVMNNLNSSFLLDRNFKNILYFYRLFKEPCKVGLSM
jgi:hypothetical protein